MDTGEIEFNFTTDFVAPEINITSPLESVFYEKIINISGETDSDIDVVLYINDAKIETVSSNSIGEYEFEGINLKKGVNIVSRNIICLMLVVFLDQIG